MKRPSVKFDQEAVLDFLLRHGEKFVVAVAGLCAAWLVWGGISALNSKSVGSGQLPEAISRKAADALTHLDRVAEPPAELLPDHPPLFETIDPWRKPLVPWRSVAAVEVVDAPPVTPLDKPLFDELARRPKPEVFPLEDLRATSGIAVLAVKAGGQAAADPAGVGGGSGRIVPYVLVTGLIPARKQRDEYRRRFADVGFPDVKRDSPLWSDFEIDRALVVPGGQDSWQRIDLAAVAKSRAAEWAAAAAATVPAEYLLAAAEDSRSPQTTPVAFCGPLPERVDGGWKADDLHPWVVEQMQAKSGPGTNPQPGSEPQPATQQPPGEKGSPQGADYRLFRFIDTAVEPGKAYKYRVRLKVWNPNLGLPQQQLVDASLAKDQKLSAPDSGASAAVTVPEPLSLLVRTIRAAELKRMRLKPDVFEILVLAESRKTGNYALRSLRSAVGGIANVDNKLNKPPADVRCQGEDIETKWVLIDALGQQLDRVDAAPPKGAGKPISEPLEMLFMRPDGSFATVSAADSALRIAQYATTLADTDDGKREPKSGPQEPPPANPFAPTPRTP